MRRFILGSLLASVVWIFVSLGGGTKINQAWTNYQQTEMIATTERLANERERAFLENYQPDNRCSAPTSELNRLECRNRMDMARSGYYTRWNRANSDRFPK